MTIHGLTPTQLEMGCSGPVRMGSKGPWRLLESMISAKAQRAFWVASLNPPSPQMEELSPRRGGDLSSGDRVSLIPSHNDSLTTLCNYVTLSLLIYKWAPSCIDGIRETVHLPQHSPWQCVLRAMATSAVINRDTAHESTVKCCSH